MKIGFATGLLIIIGVGVVIAQTPSAKVVILPSRAAQLDGIADTLKRGEAEQALNASLACLTQCNSIDLPKALYLAGKSRAQLAEKTTDDEKKKKLRLQAALDFMRVATFYPYADDAPDSLLQAGIACEAAGDKAGAAGAYRLAINRDGSSPAAKAAKTALEKLK